MRKQNGQAVKSEQRPASYGNGSKNTLKAQAITPTKGNGDESGKRLKALYDRIQHSEPTAAEKAEFSRLLKENKGVSILTGWGDLAPSWAVNAILSQELDEKKQEYGWEKAQPIERDLISHLLKAYANKCLTERKANAILNREHNTATGLYWQGRVRSEQNNYLRAVEMLARVRRLLTPAMQLNIAKNQQVNNGR